MADSGDSGTLRRLIAADPGRPLDPEEVYALQFTINKLGVKGAVRNLHISPSALVTLLCGRSTSSINKRFRENLQTLLVVGPVMCLDGEDDES